MKYFQLFHFLTLLFVSATRIYVRWGSQQNHLHQRNLEPIQRHSNEEKGGCTVEEGLSSD